jgi:hypothetical protein
MQRTLLILVAVLLVLPVPASAQSSGTNLADIVPNLILTGITLPGGEAPGNPHAGHFTLGNPTAGGSQAASRVDTAAVLAVEAFGDRFRSQFANFPLGSSTGGFTYTFDETSGTFSRSSASFGPAFTERARTIGRGRFSAGVNFQYNKFDTFGDVDLTDGSLTFYLPHTDCCNAAFPPPSANVPGFEGDLLEASVILEAKTSTFAFLANYGVTDRVDLGVVVPVSSVDIDATVNASIIRLSTAGNPTVHTFTQGQDEIHQTFSDSGSATGIGDIVIRSKYVLFSQGETGIAAAFDLRLPTGDEKDLLGIGTTQGKVYAILSGGTARLGTHVNVGYTFSGKGEAESDLVFESPGISDEFAYAGGVDFVAHPRLTVIGDIIGRTLIDAGQIGPEDKSFQYRVGAGATDTPLVTSSTNPLTNQPYQQLNLTPGNLNLVLGTVGAKYNVAPNLLISGNVLFPLTKGGLRDTLTISFGLDYAF